MSEKIYLTINECESFGPEIKTTGWPIRENGSAVGIRNGNAEIYIKCGERGFEITFHNYKAYNDNYNISNLENIDPNLEYNKIFETENVTEPNIDGFEEKKLILKYPANIIDEENPIYYDLGADSHYKSFSEIGLGANKEPQVKTFFMQIVKSKKE